VLIRRLRARLPWLVRDVGYFHAPRIGSALRKAWVKLRNPHATIEFGRHAYVGPGFSLHIPEGGTFIAGRACEFRRGFRCELGKGAVVRIGEMSIFTHYSLIQCSTRIEIGERCMFGQSSQIVDGNHRFRDLTKPMLEQGYDFREVHIADDVTTTTKCTIIADIGTKTFVGANSVVSRDLPAYVVAVGSPAKAVDYFGPAGSEPPGFEPVSSSATNGSDDSDSPDQAARKSGASS
jgi:acetyltransferase-like isoleucine patch superfamily enzyme